MAMQLTPTSLCAHNALAFSNSSVLALLVAQPRLSQRVSYGDCGVCSSSGQKTLRSVVCKSNEERTPPTAETSPLVKLAWYGSEAFGNAVSLFRPKPAEPDDGGEHKFDGYVERKYAVELIKKDFDRSYFVTGNMATGIYEEDCEFADPFVSFKGLKRFRDNVGNLGSFMEESTLKLTEWQEYEDRIYARWRFNCVLSLPWRPILAVHVKSVARSGAQTQYVVSETATGSTEYFFSKDSGKIYRHVESWDISPADGVRQLFKPNRRAKK